MSLTDPTVVGYMNSHDGKLYESKDTCLFWKQRARALELMTVAEHEQIAAPLLERIKELETWQAEHWAALQHIDSFMIGRGLLRITEDGGPAAAAKNITNSIAELEQQLEVARKDAGRYRWILKNCIRAVDLAANAIPLTDAAIDAAISKEQA